MSMKEGLYEALRGHGVKYIDLDRDVEVKGVPSIEVVVYFNDTKHEFTFAKGNHMDTEHMATVIKSYLRNRT